MAPIVMTDLVRRVTNPGMRIAAAFVLAASTIPAAAQPGLAPPPALPPAPAPPPRSDRWATLTVLHDRANDGYGVRAELDVLARGPWHLGAAVSMVETSTGLEHAGSATGHLELRDHKVVLVLAHHLRLGPWMVRSAIGAGALETDANGWGQTYVGGSPQYAQAITARGVFPVLEATLAAAYSLGDNWAVAAGLVLTRIDAELEAGVAMIERSDVEILWAAGLKHRL